MELKNKLINLLYMYKEYLPDADIEAINILIERDNIEDWIAKTCVYEFIKKCLVLILSKKFINRQEFDYPKNFIVTSEEEVMYKKAVEIMRAYADIGIYLSQNCEKNLLVSIFNKTIWLSNINESQRIIIKELRDAETNPQQLEALNDFIFMIESYTTDKFLPLFYKTTNSSIKYHIAKKDIKGLLDDYINYYNFKLIIISGNTEMIDKLKKVVMKHFDNYFQNNLNLQFKYFNLEKDYNEIKEKYEYERKLLFSNDE